MSPKYHALSLNEYNIRTPPYASGLPHEKVFSYVQGWSGSDYSRNIVVNEKQHPYTGTNYAWVRARCLGGKTNIWGRLALRMGDLDFKADVARRLRRGLADRLRGRRAVLRPGGPPARASPVIAEGLPYLPDSIFQRPFKLNAPEVHLRKTLQRMGRTATPYRAGVTTDGLLHNKYRSKCYGRGACSRRAGGCDIHAAFDSPTGLIYPAQDTGRLAIRTNATARAMTVDPATGKARGVAFVDTETGRDFEARARAVVVAASTLESARLLLLSASRQHPAGLGNSSGHVGHNFCEHLMGPSVTGLVKERIGAPRTLDDGRPGGFYVPRFRNVKRASGRISSAPTASRAAAARRCSPTTRRARPASARRSRRRVRDYSGAFISMGGFGEVLPRYENSVSLDAGGQRRLGHSRAAFQLSLRRQRAQDGGRHGRRGQGDVRRGRLRGRRPRPRRC